MRHGNPRIPAAPGYRYDDLCKLLRTVQAIVTHLERQYRLTLRITAVTHVKAMASGLYIGFEVEVFHLLASSASDMILVYPPVVGG